MEDKKIKVGITQGDVNGVGYEVILKTFGTEEMFELCTPVVYGSSKIASYHRKALDLETNFNLINSAQDAAEGRLNIINCNEEEVRVELGKSTAEGGNAALQALERAVKDYKEEEIDVIVTAPINKLNIQCDSFTFSGHTEYMEDRLGNGKKALMILVKNDFRVALVTGHIPLREVASAITKPLVEEKIKLLHRSLKGDFCIDAPRIAVLALNPHAGEGGLLGKEETEVIAPAVQAMAARGIQCFGPFSADGLIGSRNYEHFDALLAMYHDQGLAPFKALAMDEGVNFTAGLPVVRTSPAHGTAYDIAGKNSASPNSFRQAVYLALDVFRNRKIEEQINKNPLRKQYFERRDDSDKLNLQIDDEQ